MAFTDTRLTQRPSWLESHRNRSLGYAPWRSITRLIKERVRGDRTAVTGTHLLGAERAQLDARPARPTEDDRLPLAADPSLAPHRERDGVLKDCFTRRGD
jgi:hypothetical protein